MLELEMCRWRSVVASSTLTSAHEEDQHVSTARTRAPIYATGASPFGEELVFFWGGEELVSARGERVLEPSMDVLRRIAGGGGRSEGRRSVEGVSAGGVKGGRWKTASRGLLPTAVA